MHDPHAVSDTRQSVDNTCTFCNHPYSESRPAVLVPNTATVYGHGACIASSTIGMKAVSPLDVLGTLSLDDLLTKGIASLDAWLDCDPGQPRLISDLHDCMDALVTARAEHRRQVAESTELVLGA